MIRIGLAHGSLGLFPNLPEDDHLIGRGQARFATASAVTWRLRALAQSRSQMRVRADGAERTAY